MHLEIRQGVQLEIFGWNYIVSHTIFVRHTGFEFCWNNLKMKLAAGFVCFAVLLLILWASGAFGGGGDESRRRLLLFFPRRQVT